MSTYGTWVEEANCRGVDPESFYPADTGGGTSTLVVTKARRICAECPVIAQCARRALANNERYGVWAGVNMSTRTTATSAYLQRLASGVAS